MFQAFRYKGVELPRTTAGEILGKHRPVVFRKAIGAGIALTKAL